MKLNEMFPKKYATGEDLAGKEATLIISCVVAETMRPDPRAQEVTKFVLYFEKAQRGIILNRTIAEQIAQAVGSDDSDLWTGKKITLYPVPMVVAGKHRIAIRVKPSVNGPSDPPPEFQDED